MSKARIEGMFLLVFGSFLFLAIGCLGRTQPHLEMLDFKALYFASQALIHHQDPYNEASVLSVFQAAHVGSLPPVLLSAITLCVNLPTTLVFLAPIALLPWSVACVLWIALLASVFLLAACLMWSEGAAQSPRVAGLLVCIVLVGSPVILQIGNLAGLAVGLCVVGAWCLVRQRFVPAGILCLALSLLLKPQDAGLIWLFFLLAGQSHRRRALQVFALAVVLFVPAALWVSRVSPHWASELSANLAFTAAPHRLNDPGIRSVEPACGGAMIVSLQTVTSLFCPDPRVYNWLSYLICAPFFLAWMIVTLRARCSGPAVWYALAAIAPLSILPVYHRQHDAGLIVLVIPACAMLWSQRQRRGRFAVALTAPCLLLTVNLVIQLLGLASYALRTSATGLRLTLITLATARPVPLALLALTAFYVSHFVRSTASQPALKESAPSPELAASALAGNG